MILMFGSVLTFDVLIFSINSMMNKFKIFMAFTGFYHSQNKPIKNSHQRRFVHAFIYYLVNPTSILQKVNKELLKGFKTVPKEKGEKIFLDKILFKKFSWMLKGALALYPRITITYSCDYQLFISSTFWAFPGINCW